MRSQSILPDSRDIRGHASFSSHGLDNVMGVVYEAAYKYIMERAARAPRDVATFIPFDDVAEIIFSAWDVRDHARILDSMLRHPPRGGTHFNTALETMHRAVETVLSSNRCSCTWLVQSRVQQGFLTMYRERTGLSLRLCVHAVCIDVSIPMTGFQLFAWMMQCHVFLWGWSIYKIILAMRCAVASAR